MKEIVIQKSQTNSANLPIENLSADIQPIPNTPLSHLSPESFWLANFTSAHTRKSYHHAIQKFILDLGLHSSEALYAVEQAHVLAWREHLRQTGMSNTSISQHLSALSSLYKHLTDQRYCTHNPVSGVLRPGNRGKGGVGSGHTPALTARQVTRLLDAPLHLFEQRKPAELQQLRDHALLTLYFFTGARCSEPTQLQVKDLYLDRGYWVLRFQTKGEKINTVAIAREEDEDENPCLCALRRYLQAAGHGSDPDAPLFGAIKGGKNTGGALTSDGFYKLFKKYVRLAGLPDTLTPHSARATFITQAYELGIAGEDIQKTVGHRSITTTETYNQSKSKLRKSASLAVKY